MLQCIYNIFNPYKWMEWFDVIIRKECDKIDSIEPSLEFGIFNIQQSPCKAIVKLHERIVKNHDQILNEYKLMQNGGLPMTKLDYIQNGLLQGNSGWKTHWVRCQGADTINKYPTLNAIIQDIPEVLLLYISVLEPGMYIPPHYGVTKFVHRYHYGLSVPEGDTCLNLQGAHIKWINGQGIIWDDTVLHSAHNYTNERRVIIFADVERELPKPYLYIGRFLYWLIKKTQHYKQVIIRINSS